jgi:hypothetical protein
MPLLKWLGNNNINDNNNNNKAKTKPIEHYDLAGKKRYN